MTATIGSPVVAGARWDPPAAIAVRGTVLILPGRGEHAGVYDRFGRRIAADGYAVRSATPETAVSLAQDAPGPVVLAGSDTGALHALAVAAAHPDLFAGVVAAGAPAADGVTVDWDDELRARTACPTHQARLTGDTGFQRGALALPVAANLLAPAPVTVPVLVLHGEADTVSPVDAARRLAADLPKAELATVRDGRHDVLNDATHRTVAAHVVQWLERLRADADATPILTVHPH
ncbi:alpha/beta hydrolase [Dactylosporangium siamense]|uniref:Lysophospholipase n=1 Tax=Dactylosporangium siamense TaxID=685454 RepID=A0A919UGC7_9ACTN|nr:alpha/beta hydrolase [Dactylosporangium siamense]GIG49528.1 lysophospholipase [Dactylosporangium siamense]